MQMEAAQPGAQPDQAAVDAALNDLQQAVADVQTRVSGDLDALRQQLEAANAAHTEIDLTAVIQKVQEIQVTIQQIDPSAPAPADPGAPPAAGDQGAPPPPADTAGPPAGDGGAGDVGGGQPPSQ